MFTAKTGLAKITKMLSTDKSLFSMAFQVELEISFYAGYPSKRKQSRIAPVQATRLSHSD
jgi:hypothetical protein